MTPQIQNVPADLMSILSDANATQHGKCYENCVVAVLGTRISRQLRYVVGFLTPPDHPPFPHAWLEQEMHGGPIYLDPTLQASSALWNSRKNIFMYSARYSFNKDELLKWFRVKYAGREFNELGLPVGDIQGPVLNSKGELEPVRISV
ncbi:hypothetical protein GTP44_15440 [Duganella sp. FT50W]|uniref:Uncharacterized protein n=1 Tax=Duganella lactea TaxID=2692173 RepID=A0A6L8MN28_9BURK|nr:hypothetical protein [Duganella lactea]MYM83342.1 hypothetical protein [Duganella lactea]